jgi:hypothetical protein
LCLLMLATFIVTPRSILIANAFFISSSVVIDGIHVHCQEEELKRGELEADKDKMMREYRAQLDALDC